MRTSEVQAISAWMKFTLWMMVTWVLFICVTGVHAMHPDAKPTPPRPFNIPMNLR